MIRPLTEKEQLEYRLQFLETYLIAIKKEKAMLEKEYQLLLERELNNGYRVSTRE